MLGIWDRMWIDRKVAEPFFAACTKAGVPLTLETRPTTWRVRPRPHADLRVLADICDEHELEIYYGPGGDEDLGIVIFGGGKL